MESLIQDVRYAVRLLMRRTGFTAVAIATLALGIGANVSVFTLVETVLLHPLPVPEPERLVNVYTTDTSVDVPGFTLLPTSYRNFEDLREHNDAFADLAFSAPMRVVLTHEDEPEPVSGYVVSANYFDVLGITPALGRFFAPEEDELGGAHQVAVLSHAVWENRFGSDTDIVGQSLGVNQHPFTIVGVAPPGFRGRTTLVNAEQIWVPTSVYDRVLSGIRAERFLHRRGLFVNVFGRLKPDIPLGEARSEMQTLAAALAEQYPRDNRNRSLEPGLTTDASYGTTPYRSADESRRTRTAARVLFAVCGLVLLIACVNIANLLLARGADREKEMSLRAELGATPQRLVRQLVVESLVLAVLGGSIGLALAAWGRDLLWHLRPPQMATPSVDLSFDATVLVFALGTTLVTGVVFGLAPALLVGSSQNLHARLGNRDPETQQSRGRLRKTLVASEVALAFVTLVAAGLFLRSLQEGRAVDPGFESRGLFTYRFDLEAAGYDHARALAFYEEALEAVRSLPGVDVAALSDSPPLAVVPYRLVIPEGEAFDADRFAPTVTVNVVSDAYFETLEIPLVEGRTLDFSDRSTTRPVAVVTRSMAERFWPSDETVVGRRFRFSGSERFYEIVGVVDDVLVRGPLGEPEPVAYLAIRQNVVSSVTMNVRAVGSVEPVMGSSRERMRELDPKLAITEERSVESLVADGLWAPRAGAALLSLFGFLAVLLAAIGVYGVLAYAVRRRTREVGIRMAVGASRLQIHRLLIVQGMLPALAGLGAGVLAALVLAREAGSLLYRVSPHDGPTFLAAAAVLVATAFVACWVPVRRAARLEPLKALGGE